MCFFRGEAERMYPGQHGSMSGQHQHTGLKSPPRWDNCPYCWDKQDKWPVGYIYEEDVRVSTQ